MGPPGWTRPARASSIAARRSEAIRGGRSMPGACSTVTRARWGASGGEPSTGPAASGSAARATAVIAVRLPIKLPSTIFRIDAFIMVSRSEVLDVRTGAGGKPTFIFSPIGASAVSQGEPSSVSSPFSGATMTRPRPFLLLSLLAFVALAIAACATERKPIRGFDKPPPGTIVLDADPGGTVVMWPIFDGTDGSQVFRARLNSQDAVIMSSQDGYDYLDWTMQGGWTGGWDDWLTGIPPGTYVVEIDSAGQTWGKSAPL